MAKKKKKVAVTTGYEEAKKRVLDELNRMSPWDDGYDEMLRRLKDIEDLMGKNRPKEDHISKDAILQTTATVGMFAAAFIPELKGHVVGKSFTRRIPQLPWFKRTPVDK